MLSPSPVLQPLVRRALSAAALALAAAAAGAADVGVSIAISQPGVYGRIDIGRFPRPVVVVPQPVVVAAPAVRVDPVYLWVPDDHRRHWKRHCKRYGACGVPVYFVQDRWYQQHVMPVRHAGKPGRGEHPGRGHGRGRHDD
jgi:hypothetical protein